VLKSLLKLDQHMISTEQIIVISISGIIALAIFLLMIFYYSKPRKTELERKTPNEQTGDNADFKICFEIWQQERSFAVQRLILVLTSNSILFLGYVQVRVSLLGGIIAIFAIICNFLYAIYLSAFAKTLDTLQKRLESRLPTELKKRSLTGRWGFVPLILILQSIWVVSAVCSFLGWFQ
jgi:ABC-type antimicrobial peptide transport system permease subunit